MVARICLIVGLFISLGPAGCSSYRTACYPAAGDPVERDGADGRRPVVAVGDRVEVTLQGGEKIKGRVLKAAPAVLMLTRREYAQVEQGPPVSVDADAIESIKVAHGSAAKTTVLVGISVGIIGGLVALSTVQYGP